MFMDSEIRRELSAEGSTAPMIECENLVKIYKTEDIEVLALQGLELRVERGELLAIVGSSGSGKSTFLNMLGGLDRPSAGQLRVDGKDLFKMTERELVEYKQRTVGFVWQNNARNLLPYLSAWQNVQMPMLFCSGAEKKKRALELLEMVGMSARKNSRLSQLSGGEQQRIAIAVALANQPKLLLADEPTGSVDAKTGAYILDMLKEINRSTGLTVVIVTHDQALASKADRTVAIRDGKISSERVRRQSSRSLADIAGFSQESSAQEEFAVLDRAGRLQLPKELLERIRLPGNRVRLGFENGRITIEHPEK